jgi:hypothetical protein
MAHGKISQNAGFEPILAVGGSSIYGHNMLVT